MAPTKPKAKPVKKPAHDPETCGHCKHFESNVTDPYGWCNRYPPVVVVTDAVESGLSYERPIVECSETCGEFKRRLNS